MQRRYRAKWPKRSKASDKKFRARWPDKIKAKNLKYYRPRERLITQVKSVPCMDCKRQYPAYVMDLDHRDRTTKLFGIGNGHGRNMEILIAEIAKCDVVCSNCHRERTFGGRENEKSLPERNNK